MKNNINIYRFKRSFVAFIVSLFLIPVFDVAFSSESKEFGKGGHKRKRVMEKETEKPDKVDSKCPCFDEEETDISDEEEIDSTLSNDQNMPLEISPLERIAPEVLPHILQHIFSYLPLESHDEVTRVNKDFYQAAKDITGPFYHLRTLIDFYKSQKRKLQKEHKFDLNGSAEILNSFRQYVAKHIEPMPSLQRTELLKHVFSAIKNDKYIKYHTTVGLEISDWQKNQLLNEIRYEGEGKREQMRSAYLQLAFLRSCYDILTPVMRKWLLYTSKPSNKLFECKRFYPISSTWDLICILQHWMLNVPNSKKTNMCLNELRTGGKVLSGMP
jgi:hypothetical protein